MDLSAACLLNRENHVRRPRRIASACIIAVMSFAVAAADEAVSCVGEMLVESGLDLGHLDGALDGPSACAVAAPSPPFRSPVEAMSMHSTLVWCAFLRRIPAPALRALAAARHLYLGTAVAADPLQTDTSYRQALRQEFNIVVSENSFKFSVIHPDSTRYDFSAADALVDFAEDNGMAVRGHALVWHNRVPEWIVALQPSREQAIELLREHISTVVGRYRGRIKYWDVVNEAIDDETLMLREDSFWYQAIGPSYITLAFAFAHDADPEAILYYNEYGAEDMSEKANAVYDLLSALVVAGVPISGVGWEMHVENGFRVTDSNRQNGLRIAALGLEVTITEMDVKDRLPTTLADLATQAAAFGDVVELCLELPNCPAVLLWGFTDRYSWIPSFFSGYGNATIYDGGMNRKPAYYAILHTLQY